MYVMLYAITPIQVAYNRRVIDIDLTYNKIQYKTYGDIRAISYGK